MSGIDGYVADSLYPSCFHQHFTPPWIDAILTAGQIAPPRDARAPFSMVDIGCGDGVGLIQMAAAHPEGRFTGVDAMPEHVSRGQALIEALGLRNVELIAATFVGAQDRLQPATYDYALCNGVLAWVSPENRTAALTLAAQSLRPGGVLATGYNAMPGWQMIAPFQRMVLALARGRPGTPTERFEAAVTAARTSGALTAELWDWFDAMQPKVSPDYLPHEYLNEHWQPLWADELMHAAEAVDLHLAGEARQWRLRDDFALQAKWRAMLEDIADPSDREVARDIVTASSFRTDLYVKGAAVRLDEVAQERMQLDRYWYAPCPSEQAQYETRTPAGTIRFDNESARAILARLQPGPARLRDVEGFDSVDLLNSADALFMAGLIAPVDPAVELDAPAINQRICDFAGEDGKLGLVTPYGAIHASYADLLAGRSTLGSRVGLMTAPPASQSAA